MKANSNVAVIIITVDSANNIKCEYVMEPRVYFNLFNRTAAISLSKSP